MLGRRFILEGLSYLIGINVAESRLEDHFGVPCHLMRAVYRVHLALYHPPKVPPLNCLRGEVLNLMGRGLSKTEERALSQLILRLRDGA